MDLTPCPSPKERGKNETLYLSILYTPPSPWERGLRGEVFNND
jgi:hypothetical protein